MRYSIKLLPIVYQDLKNARRWYNEQQKSLGEEFQMSLIKEIEYISEHPEHYQRKYRELRQFLLPRFPYAIFYLVEKNKRRSIIFGVLHTSRNPELIKDRKGK